MELILQNDKIIKDFAYIQKCLCDLEPFSNNNQIDIFIKRIPLSYLNRKEYLMMICQLFALYARKTPNSKKMNVIKLFNSILIPIKKYLHDESLFFWKIFGGILYFKLWMFEEGLITIDTIIQMIRGKSDPSILEYYLPEIIENEPEIFEKEIKPNIKIPYSKEIIDNFKNLRKKHFKWLQDSSDYHDIMYKEIEDNQLRLAIKTDDIDSFQKILSNSNLSVNAKIRESILEKVLIDQDEISLLEYAIQFNSINIIKYLLMNNVEIPDKTIDNSMIQQNYEIIHLIESKTVEKFPKKAFYSSITYWNDEITEYVSNYYYNFLEDNYNQNAINDEFILDIAKNTFSSFNFIFFSSYLLPFLLQNPLFVTDNIHSLTSASFDDQTCFFTKELLKYPQIDINHAYRFQKINLFIDAILHQNASAVKLIINHPEIDLYDTAGSGYSPFQYACAFYSDLKIIEMICNHPKFDVFWQNEYYENSLYITIIRGNSYAIDYLIEHFPQLISCNVYPKLISCFNTNHLLISKIILKYYLKMRVGWKNISLINEFKNSVSILPNFQKGHLTLFSDILYELQQV